MAMTQEELDRALFAAAKTGDLARLRELVASGADVGARDKEFGATALHYAAQDGRKDIAEFFVRQDRKLLHVRDGRGRLPLHRASTWDLETVAFFVREDRSLLRAVDGAGDTFLHVVALYGGKDVVEFLVRQDRSLLHVRNASGSTPLHMAALNDQDGIVQFLLESGADPCAQSEAVADHPEGVRPSGMCHKQELGAMLLAAEMAWERDAALAAHLVRQRHLGKLRRKGPSI